MDRRVVFDFDIEFTNGGGIQGQDFRLDIEKDKISDKELADYIVADLHLLMVGKVTILNKYYVEERHKRKTNSENTTKELLIDLSHTIENGLVTYKGLPAPIICDYLSRENSKQFYEEGTQFQIGKIEMVTNTGTYLDCPFHRYEHGKDLSEIELAAFTDLDAIVIRIPYTDTLNITAQHLKGYEVRNRAVLIHTGWDSHWNTETYYENHPSLTNEAAEYLRDCEVKLVGIDSHNIDDTRGKSRPVHTILLGSEILIVEHLCNLSLLPDDGFSFSAIPPKFKGVGTFPVRAMAKIYKK
ncbi:cyclase family protein [Cytophagaceae bacterium DM2B3-1]|uniref:Cyclase family protein n=1 Tax=Xanthocytophaga flava TaxID=3048013 RepID=A0ABT7CI71_9BACT|nr:cyclase family protein [Xanthocytophaga flavus]MDJ1468534.1 cyclase family protein [Xanthocytophaga flavus]MDJ1493429.1 cyclase family protein [Xanthocytophaga flavus]